MKSTSTDSELLTGFKPDPESALSLRIQKVLFVARRLQERASELQTPQERRQQSELDRMLQNPRDKTTLVQMTDQSFRSRVPHRAAEQFVHILDVQGVPRFFSPLDRTLLRGFQSFGAYLPGVAMPLVKERMHRETANVILPAEHDLLRKHLEERRREGIRMNVNHLGEAILSEPEAERRLEEYLRTLDLDEVEVVSVKISTVYSQISLLARDHSLDVICGRLERLYRAAHDRQFRRADGTQVPKFVYLDMEEYRDLHLTVDAFMRTLERPGLERFSAGIVLQAYIPDSSGVQRRLNAWARRRVARGGAPVTLRIVKGANLEMERVEASLRGWPQAPFRTKVETDANYKRMLEEGMRVENLDAVRLGVASHNLFDLTYGLVLAIENEALDRVHFEMLEGMANHQRRALFEKTQKLLLYAPVCSKEHFIHAIGYLVRRLDENTGPDNFLRHAFAIHVDSAAWQRLEAGFLKSFDAKKSLGDKPRRRQDRGAEASATLPVKGVCLDWDAFENEPDTDFALPRNVAWAECVIAEWNPRCGEGATEIPLVIDGVEILEGRSVRDCLDPSRPGTVVGRYRQADEGDVERAVACARDGDRVWRELDPQARAALLGKVAGEIRRARGDLIGAAIADGGKTVLESDPEVSEAVDFVEFYRASAMRFHALANVEARGKGVVVVVSPWNFPIAIPCGGVAAALAAGNCVILKPASDAVLPAWILCQCFWRGGVSKQALQFVPCAGAGAGQRLVTHDDVDVVILTGGTETAETLLRAKPGMTLLAETGGKNATIVTAISDRDQAIQNVLHSAFGHAGQKCSATSLLLLESEVYDDPMFAKSLAEATASLGVGSAWDFQTTVGPLIGPPSGALREAIESNDEGESWLLEPENRDGNPNLYSPGIKWGVRPGSRTHATELFGPVLGVIRFDKLQQAVAIVNDTGFGLTSGLESLDEREQEEWGAGIRAGNLYINRGTTGATVLRQPFGGMGRSAFGPGIKAGGPNYVAQLMEFADADAPMAQSDEGGVGDDTASAAAGGSGADELLAELYRALAHPTSEIEGIERWQVGRILAAMASGARSQRDEFGRAHDHFRLLGQDNIRCYLPVHRLRVRVHLDDSPFEILARVCAARVVGCRFAVSVPPDARLPVVDSLERLTESWAGAIEFVEEPDEALCQAVMSHQVERLRYARRERVPPAVRSAAAARGVYVADAPVLAEGRIELLWYVREQSLSVNYHRYGNLGARATEQRADVK